MFSAGAKLQRAALYLFNGERMLAHGAPGRIEAFQKAGATFQKATHLSGENCERVEIPIEGGTMPALFTRAHSRGETVPRPAMER